MNRMILSAVAGIALLGGALWPAHSQPLRFVEAQFADESGAPLVNQIIVVERHPEEHSTWFGWLFGNKPEQKPVVSITDWNGFVQIVDLPPGQYKMRLVRPAAPSVP